MGTIKCSNLCTEIVEYSSKDEASTRMTYLNAFVYVTLCFVVTSKQVAVCNLASIALNMFVKPDRTYDMAKLKEITKVITRNLNKIIDVNYYPVPEVCRAYLARVCR